jgi:hypothetical protein
MSVNSKANYFMSSFKRIPVFSYEFYRFIDIYSFIQECSVSCFTKKSAVLIIESFAQLVRRVKND